MKTQMQFLYGYLGPKAKAVFTTKSGGNSLGRYGAENGNGLNLGNHVGDDNKKVELNRKQVEDYFEINLAFMEQTHSNIVQYIDNNNYCLENADSIVISINEECADRYYVPTVMVADCTPVLLANLDGDVLAAVHVGRQGMINGVLLKTLEKFSDLKVPSQEIYACIGPSICENCYEVTDEKIYSECISVEPKSAWLTPKGTNAINIREVVKDQLLRKGIVNISSIDLCTFENEDFYSYRRSKVCGRQVGFVLPVRTIE